MLTHDFRVWIKIPAEPRKRSRYELPNYSSTVALGDGAG